MAESHSQLWQMDNSIHHIIHSSSIKIKVVSLFCRVKLSLGFNFDLHIAVGSPTCANLTLRRLPTRNGSELSETQSISRESCFMASGSLVAFSNRCQTIRLGGLASACRLYQRATEQNL